MSKFVVGIFQSEVVAKEAVEDLRNAGFSKDISILAKDRDSEEGNRESGLTMSGNETVSDGATAGGILGGVAGLAIGAGALVVPGLGPLIAAGPLAGILSGAATGGVAGALVDWGIPAEEGRRYEEEIKQGKIMVTIDASNQDSGHIEEILRDHGADEVKTHER